MVGRTGRPRGIRLRAIPARKSDPVFRAGSPWEGLGNVSGREIRLVFHMRDSHLFSFRSSGRRERSG